MIAPYFKETATPGTPATERDHVLRVYRATRRRVAAMARVDDYSRFHTARAALKIARDRVQQVKTTGHTSRIPRYIPDGIWARRGGSDGATFAAYGETACRWIENPESKGLRLAGLAHDVHPRAVRHTGWYTDDDGHGDSVSGVVYQLPARRGRVRFLAGYADPWNTDKDGVGPALLSLEVYESANPGYFEETSDAAHDAARAADGMAESMAENEREYRAANDAGRDARAKAGEALEACRAWVAELRDVRAMFSERHSLGVATPTARALWAKHIRTGIKDARRACVVYLETRDAARALRDDAPGPPHPNHAGTDYGKQKQAVCDAWADGYAEGVY